MLRFHERVRTPDGEGVVQGYTYEDNKTKILVSMDFLPTKEREEGMWTLKEYPPSKIKKMR